jgi:hypothetical protein
MSVLKEYFIGIRFHHRLLLAATEASESRGGSENCNCFISMAEYLFFRVPSWSQLALDFYSEYRLVMCFVEDL